MEEFAALIDALVYTRSRNEKLRLIAEYLRATPDPDRGWALAALADGLDFPAVKSSTIRNLLKDRIDPVLWTLSRDFVGDTAETASLLWPAPDKAPSPPTVGEAVELLGGMNRKSVLSELPLLLDRLDPSGRYALLKLATGGMRIGVSSRLAKTAFAQAFDVSVEEVEEYWHGLDAPYDQLFGWAARGEPAPDIDNLPTFRPFMLAHPLEETVVDLADYAAEWKWDGIRVQLVRAGNQTRVYSRSGDDISATFPELLDVLPFPAVLDGELLVRGDVQGGAEDREPATGLAKHRLVVHVDVVESHLGEVVALQRTHRQRADLDAIGRRVHKKDGDTAMPPRRVDRGRDEEDAGLGRVRDKHLAAGQPPASIHWGRPGPHGRQVGSATGLGEAG